MSIMTGAQPECSSPRRMEIKQMTKDKRTSSQGHHPGPSGQGPRLTRGAASPGILGKTGDVLTIAEAKNNPLNTGALNLICFPKGFMGSIQGSKD